MITTREDAKNKWCSQARIARSTVSGSFNRFRNMTEEHTPPESKCISSSCMMWCPINDAMKTGMCGLTISMQMGINVNCRKE